TAKDMSLLEINPLVVTRGKELVCLDAKISFDDNALYRHPDIVALRDLTEEDEKEIEASKYDLNYVALDGTIGCMVNGAGLAMATWNISKLAGQAPAISLDGGGGARRERLAPALKTITADPKVQGILVNIFGGIMKCDVIAEGVVAAVKEVGLRVPLVVRLESTNVELGKDIIAKSNLNVTSADDLDDAAQKTGMAVKGTWDEAPPKTGGRSSCRSLFQALVCGRCIEPAASLNAPHAHSHRQEHQGHLPGFHRQERHVSFRAGDRLRHQDGWRHIAGQRRHHSSRPAGLQHRSGGEGEDRLRRERDLRAAGWRCGCDLRSDPGRNRPYRLHHRRHS